jgi:hypothetical protein
VAGDAVSGMRQAITVVLMRHYPFPPPRVAQVRLTGGLIPWAGEATAAQAWGGEFGS